VDFVGGSGVELGGGGMLPQTYFATLVGGKVVRGSMSIDLSRL
jgi:hypothetical protein